MSGVITAAALTAYGTYRSGKSAKEAAATTAESTDRATELQRQMYEEGVARQKPFLDTGTEFFNRLAELQRGGPSAAQNFLQMDPGYAFRLGEGMKALEASRAAKGGLLSGATGKALQRYGQEMGSQEYGNAFNRFQTERANRLQPLSGLTTLGQAAASNQGAAAGAFGQTAGNLTTDIGAAQAAGGIGSANAITNALNQFARYSAGQNIADQIRQSVYAPAIR